MIQFYEELEENMFEHKDFYNVIAENIEQAINLEKLGIEDDLKNMKRNLRKLQS